MRGTTCMTPPPAEGSSFELFLINAFLFFVQRFRTAI